MPALKSRTLLTIASFLLTGANVLGGQLPASSRQIGMDRSLPVLGRRWKRLSGFGVGQESCGHQWHSDYQSND